MPITDIRKDPDVLTMVVTAEFAAPIGKVWEMWNDPRQLEQWWGPPSYPATVTDHDLTPGGQVRYYMTGPEGDRHFGWWKVVDVDPSRRLEIEDGFSDEEGTPNFDMPTTMMVASLETIDTGRTRMTIQTTFQTLDAMEQLIAMGMEEGIKLAVGQIDGLLNASAASPGAQAAR